jgi:hypothetical protein
MARLVLAFLLFAATSPIQAQTAAKPADAQTKAVDAVRKLGGLALEVAQNDPHMEVSYLQIEGKFGDEHLSVLKDIKGIVHLNLRGQPVTDAQLAYLKELKDLTELHLEKTKITDKGLSSLEGLGNLEYLNLYGTDVTDAGLAHLERMKKLKKLFLWQTKVTDAGAAKLKKALPQVDINRGYEPAVVKKAVAPPAKAPTGKDDKKAPAGKDAKKPEPAKKDPAKK